MDKVSYRITVGSPKGRCIGILSYEPEADLFTFQYDDNFQGYPFGDINCNEGNFFESHFMFGHFYIEDSWTRQRTVEKYNIANPDSNAGQIELIERLIRSNGSYEGIFYEKL